MLPAVVIKIRADHGYRRELNERLDAWLAIPLTIDVDELVEQGFTPSFNLAHHGRDNRLRSIGSWAWKAHLPPLPKSMWNWPSAWPRTAITASTCGAKSPNGSICCLTTAQWCASTRNSFPTPFIVPGLSWSGRRH